MKNLDKRLTALERTAQGRMMRNLSSILSAIEEACDAGRISEAALILLEHQVALVEKRKIIFDGSSAAFERFLSQDPVLNGLSSSADAQLGEYWGTHTWADLRREVGVERFDKVRTWKLLSPPSPPSPDLPRLSREAFQKSARVRKHRVKTQPNL